MNLFDLAVELRAVYRMIGGAVIRAHVIDQLS